jgi:hypothetical protein
MYPASFVLLAHASAEWCQNLFSTILLCGLRNVPQEVFHALPDRKKPGAKRFRALELLYAAQKAFRYFSASLQQDVLQDEQHRQHVHQRADLLFTGLAGDEVQQSPGDDADGNALGDAVGQRHGDDGQESRNGIGQIIKVNLRDSAQHVEADNDQRRSGGEGRNGQEQRAEDDRQQEEDAGGHGSKAGTAALGDAGSALDIGGGSGGAQHSAHAGGDGVRQQRTLNTRQAAVLIQHIGLGGNADQGAQRIEQVNEEEGKHDGEEVQDIQTGEVHLEHLAEGLAQSGEVKADERGGDDGIHAGFRIGDIQAAQLAEDAEDPGDQDAVQNGALDLFDKHNRNDQHADQRQDRADAHAVEGFALEALVGQQRRIAVDDELGILQAHKGDEQTDTHADSGFKGRRNGVEDGFPDAGEGQHDEDDAFRKDGHQRQLPGVAHFQDDRVGKVGVQAHAGGQGKGIVGQQSHQRRADEGGQRGSDEDRVGVHAGSRKDAGVDRKDIRHGHEGGDTCHDLSFDVGMIFPQFKNFF